MSIVSIPVGFGIGIGIRFRGGFSFAFLHIDNTLTFGSWGSFSSWGNWGTSNSYCGDKRGIIEGMDGISDNSPSGVGAGDKLSGFIMASIGSNWHSVSYWGSVGYRVGVGHMGVGVPS